MEAAEVGAELTLVFAGQQLPWGGELPIGELSARRASAWSGRQRYRVASVRWHRLGQSAARDAVLYGCAEEQPALGQMLAEVQSDRGRATVRLAAIVIGL